MQSYKKIGEYGKYLSFFLTDFCIIVNVGVWMSWLFLCNSDVLHNSIKCIEVAVYKGQYVLFYVVAHVKSAFHGAGADMW